MDDPGVLPDIAAMSFEDALAELEQIVRRLEGGQVKRMRPSSATSAGPGSNYNCERKLNEAQQRVDRVGGWC